MDAKGFDIYLWFYDEPKTKIVATDDNKAFVDLSVLDIAEAIKVRTLGLDLYQGGAFSPNQANNISLEIPKDFIYANLNCIPTIFDSKEENKIFDFIMSNLQRQYKYIAFAEEDKAYSYRNRGNSEQLIPQGKAMLFQKDGDNVKPSFDYNTGSKKLAQPIKSLFTVPLLPNVLS